MKPRSFIVFGGCHVAGYGVGEQNSFINFFSSQSKTECLNIFSNFQIKNIQAIDKIIERYDPEFVLLQLGNYEFHASLKKLFLNRKSSKDSQDNSDSRQSEIETGSPANKINISFPGKNQISNNIFSNCLTSLIWEIIKKRTSVHLSQLKNIIASHPGRKFIILSPVPCIKKNDLIIRSKGGKLFKELFSSFENTTYVDLFSHIPPTRKYFKDSAHLNRRGHYLLARAISKEVNFIFENENLTIAV